MVLWQRKIASEKGESENESALSDKVKTLYVIIFSNDTKAETVSWIINLLTRSQHDGGAELLVNVTRTETMVSKYFCWT